MYLDKYTFHVKDNTTKKTFKIVLDEDTPQDAHKKIYNRLNYYQDIVKITDHEKNVVYNIDTGFINT
jgi:hypothetical protein